MRGAMAWILLLAIGVGSASISWIRIDTQGNGWIGIQLGSGEEVRVEFVDRDSSGDLSQADLNGRSRQQLSSRQDSARGPEQERSTRRVLQDRPRLQQIGN